MPRRSVFDRIEFPDDFWRRADVVEACHARDCGRLFALVKEHARASESQIGMATGHSQPRVNDYIRGRRKVARLDVIERVAQGFGAPNEIRLLLGLAPMERRAAHLDSVPASVQFAESWSDGVQDATDLWRDDMQRRGVLRGAAYMAGAFVSPALRWLTAGNEQPVRLNGDRRICRADVHAIRETTATVRRLDNRFGGGQNRPRLVRFLDAEVAPMLQSGRFGNDIGSELFSAAAEMTQLAGWMSYDTGMHGLAQRYFVHALRLAKAAGDRLLGAEVLAAMSHQAVYLGDAATAVDLARAAGQVADKAGVLALVAEAAAMEAHGHARKGSERACAEALTRAEHTLDRADRSRDPAWIAYFDEAYLSAKFGHCFHALNQPQQAERFARRSLEMNDNYVRGRAFNLSLLANVYAQQGEVPQACSVGTEALALTAGLRSARAAGYIRDLQTKLGAHGRQPDVRRFNNQVRALLGPRR